MHAKSARGHAFLDKDLLPQVKEAFGAVQAGRQGGAREGAGQGHRAGASARRGPRDAAQGQGAARASSPSDAVDVGALENEVYDHLYSFFRRYYSEGDFLAKRVYKPGVYAIPYEGEEVKLHWANARPVLHQDQRVPSRLRLPPAAGRRKNRCACTSGWRTRPRASTATSRRPRARSARLHPGGRSDFIAEEDGELVIRFEYRPATLTDWPKSREGKTQAAGQKDLTALATKRVLAVTDASLAPGSRSWASRTSPPAARRPTTRGWKRI